MEKFKVIHVKEECIGCGACAAIAPEFWEMHGDKAHIKNSKDVGETEELDVEELKSNEDAANGCPVNCIHIKDVKNNKQLI